MGRNLGYDTLEPRHEDLRQDFPAFLQKANWQAFSWEEIKNLIDDTKTVAVDLEEYKNGVMVGQTQEELAKYLENLQVINRVVSLIEEDLLSRSLDSTIHCYPTRTPVAQNASHVPSSRPVSGVQPSQAPVILSGLLQQHAQPQAAPPGLPTQQAGVQERIPSQNTDDRQISRAPNSPSKVLDRAAPSVQAPEGILSPLPYTTDAAAAAIPLEAVVSPDEGGPSASRTDGDKNRKRMMSG
uniref:Uncharacterized protein n=1 Tax=Chromera velia CCMP2878 TaxID=1169474 RepID=A0A0G4FC53_9ALVE|eukprot:Cvel_16141.t1-p1 / transcript=Cvel_16141.t1 / gene=Cvel_16141 / organism=Chromera_velia_CCMP2878 / gene_product=hypothetical protein / transcript_product=hypothetical protein / location=Cvel_scaffold1229:23695-27061(+) / protein_length=239 / sequence_SO=supercontig / SO=protein_coding / is_pseudo=false